MDNITNNSTQFFLRNTVKSFTVLIAASLAFVLSITIFPLIGSLTMTNFPILQVIKDNFKILIPLLIISTLISPLFGWAASKLRKKRFLYLFIIGIIGSWLAIVSVMLMWSNFTIGKNDIGSLIFISVWGLLAYCFLSLPFLIPSIILIEKWTRYDKKYDES